MLLYRRGYARRTRDGLEALKSMLLTALRRANSLRERRENAWRAGERVEALKRRAALARLRKLFRPGRELARSAGKLAGTAVEFLRRPACRTCLTGRQAGRPAGEFARRGALAGRLPKVLVENPLALIGRERLETLREFARLHLMDEVSADLRKAVSRRQAAFPRPGLRPAGPPRARLAFGGRAEAEAGLAVLFTVGDALRWRRTAPGADDARRPAARLAEALARRRAKPRPAGESRPGREGPGSSPEMRLQLPELFKAPARIFLKAAEVSGRLEFAAGFKAVLGEVL